MKGLYYEELEVGAVYRHALRRTVTEADNVLFSALTMNVQPLLLDAQFAESSIYGQRVVNSVYTLGLVGGFHVPDIAYGTTLGNLGYDEVRFPNPVFHGDTLRGETTILDKRLSKSRPDAGIVWFEHRGYKQDGLVVCVCRRSGLMARKRPGEPAVG